MSHICRPDTQLIRRLIPAKLSLQTVKFALSSGVHLQGEVVRRPLALRRLHQRVAPELVGVHVRLVGHDLREGGRAVPQG
uniref:S4 RNA-binding domain-containing protein n=1 Tax=Steinernema glaseri TaxID=37863 RepID=A0A1I7Y2B0_9BILA